MDVSRLGFGVVCALALGLGCGCSSSDVEPEPDPADGAMMGRGLLGGADCDPLDPHYCAYPFPSNVYLESDPSGLNPSGLRVGFGETTLPENSLVGHLLPEWFHELDGFSTGAAPMTAMPGGVPSNTATPLSIETTLDIGSPTLLMEAETGELVAHWVDFDQSQFLGKQPAVDDRAMMLRPAMPLKNGTRYIVAIRGIVDETGNELPASEVFRALRDGTDHADPSVKRRRALYADIFARLEAAGVERGGLQMAWDFTTATREGTTRKLIHMRDDALAAVGADGPELEVVSVTEAPNQHSLRTITVRMTVPSYLDTASWAVGDPGPRLVLDERGLPVQNGTMTQEVLIHVPRSAETPGVKHGLLQNGHGLFGDPSEGRNGFLARFGNEYHWVTFATKWYGFAEEDVDMATEALSGDPELMLSFMDRQHQGHVNQLLAMRMMMGRVAKNGITDDQGNVLLDPSVIDPDVRAYRGDSQGGIMGGVYMSISTDVTRGLLGQPGMPYSLLLNRSQDWPSYGFVLGVTYNSPLANQLMLGLVQMHWDRTEPNGYVAHLQDDLLPGTPPHYVVMHPAIGDHQVTTFGAHIMARAIGAGNLRSDTGELFRELWGIPAIDAPVENQSVMVEYGFDLADEPLINVPPDDGCDPHDRVRELVPSDQQQDTFFRSGVVEWTCTGLCNCDAAGEEAGCERTRDPTAARCVP